MVKNIWCIIYGRGGCEGLGQQGTAFAFARGVCFFAQGFDALLSGGCSFLFSVLNQASFGEFPCFSRLRLGVVTLKSF